jgi:TP901 family phage tail tape measure protein
MADAQSNIKVSIDTAEALANIKNLQRQISAFHTSMAKGGAAANAVTAQMQQGLINSINATGKFSAQMKTIRTTTESFTNSLEKNKFSLGEYFRYAGGASKTFGRLFKSEFETINKVARENVKDLQTQYIKMGRDANGAMKAIAVRPLSLDMNDLATKTMIASEKQALLNQLLKQGSTNLLNFGKNTQWAGRQLMVGFTLPLISVGAAASKTFMDMETQAIRFKKVYGDLFTPASETQAALDGITELGKQFTKYGVAVSQTVGLAAEAAAAGFQGLDLQRQTTAATKLSILGQVDSQKALETTISLQNAFSMSSEKLAESIDFLNAVENQTVLSLDDMSTAIPKAAPVVEQLGGDLKDLAFLMTAMKEGGINASEGANALKSGLGSLINPTGKANDMLLSFGINAKKIVEDNRGNLKATVIEFASALNQLDPLNRAQVIEQMFGKFQFARLSTLFANVTKDGTQAARVLDLAGASVQELASLSEKELGMTSESAMNKFKGAVENLKLSLVPVGEEFLKAVTPIAEFVSSILDRFNNLGDGTKRAIVIATTAVAGLGPILLMTFGLLANGIANIIKGFTVMKSLFNKTGQSTATLGTQVEYMTLEQRNAAAVAASLDQVHRNLAQTFTAEAASVDRLTAAYARSIAAQNNFMPTAMPIGRGPIKKRANGKPAVVGGTGNQDSELALLMPGETVIPTKMSKKYGSLINGMIADNIPGYSEGLGSRFVTNTSTSAVASHFDVTAPSELARTIRLVGDELKGFSTTVLKLTDKVDGEGYDLVKSQEELVSSVKDDNAVLAGGRSFGGTTTLGTGSRNTMFNAIGVKGEPFTLDALAEAGDQAAVALRENKASTQKHTVELEQLSREGATARALLQDSNNATKSRIDYMRTNAKQAITEGLLADARIKIDGKRITVEQAGIIADQRIAKVDAELETLKKSGVTTEKQILEAKRKYLAAMIKSGTGEFVVAPSGTGGGVARDTATGRPRSSNRVSFLNQKAGERQAAYGGRGAVQISALVAKDFALKGKTLIDSASTALISGARRALRIASPSKEMNNAGANAGQSLVQGVNSKNKDAVKAGQVLGDSVVSGTKSGKSSRPQGPAGIGPVAPAGANFLPITTPVKQSRMSKIKGAAGKVGSKFAGRGAAVGMAGNSAMIAAAFLPGKMGELAQKIMPAVFGFQALSMILKMLPGPFKLLAVGVGVTVGIIKLLNAAKERERLAVEGLGDAALVSEKKLKTLGDFFGIVPKKLDFLSRDNAVATTGATAQEQDAIDTLQKDKNFQKDFKNDIASLKKGTDAQAKLVFDSIAMQLRGSGFAKEQIDLIIKALQEESGKTDFKFNFANVDLSTDEGVLNFDKNFGVILKELDSGITQVYDSMMYRDNKLNKWVGGVVTKTSEEAKVNLKLAADAATGFINGLRGQLEAGVISADQFAQGFARLQSSIATMPKPEQVILLNEIFKTLPENLQKATAGMTDTGARMKILQAQSLGLAGAALTLANAFKTLNSPQVWGPEGERVLNDAQLAWNKALAEVNARAKKFEDDLKKGSGGGTNTNPFKSLDDETSGGKKLTDEERYLKILDKQIDALKAKQEAQKKANDEIQRELDLINKLEDLASQATTAKLTGNFIQAAMLTRQSVQAQQEFDRQTQLNLMEEPIDKLMARKKAIQDGAKLTKSEKAQLPKTPKKVVKKANGGLIKGPGTGRSDSIRATLGYAGGGSIRVSNGEFVVKASSVKDYGVAAMNAVNNGTADISTNSGGTVYNINMPITSNAASPEGVANEVMRRLKVELNKNNKSNRINI